VVRPGMLVDVAGTYPVLSLCTDRFAPDLEGRIKPRQMILYTCLHYPWQTP
jgi:hypothetical protein